ncbi:MAG: ACT domain-containing protein [Eubacterium sp.]|nr:ACT domain-containing protein [Eubacterium sp.]
MAITQLSAFLENTPGTLSEVVDAITDAGVNLRALSVADTRDFGILRMIVSDIGKTKEALDDRTAIIETPVVVVKMNDQAGSLKMILDVLKGADVNIEYIYAFTGAIHGSAYVVFRVDDVESAESILEEKGIKTLNDEDLHDFLN